VRAYVEADPNYQVPIDGHRNLLLPLLPSYRREGKAYLTIAFGCTGGRHRSIAVARAIAGSLREAGWPVLLHHRDTPEANDQDAPPPGEPSGREGA
jgi:UPF0042 nucleotide-binding protein